MVNFKEISKKILRERYNIDTSQMTNVDLYRKFYDFIYRYIVKLNLKDADFETCYKSINLLLDYMEKPNQDTYDELSKIYDANSLIKSRKKVLSNLNDMIEELMKIYGENKIFFEEGDADLPLIKESTYNVIINKENNDNEQEELNSIKMRLEELEKEKYILACKLKESNEKFLELKNFLKEVLEDKNLREVISKEKLLRLITICWE
ncbi:hypothetical protein [Clostridium perfringens]|uniref:hypothetical protein n=1 Tax=Clostridium perfringens TaxID=1502 RepID=UPI001ABB564F|nr:hypothetical protein [Clostridium perfringens]EJT6171015.1 hypothetical protein [Clostridium perfringens]EJT6541741.1 hypothetical protein [Clostridium perfringens]EJT6566747.1 hypothetical protein [Clostridium perfringens]MBO3319296.1 hypothetical protein [Clostridium perfringens]MBS5994517.1 hypothetical protein [Clostridium perfringens]